MTSLVRTTWFKLFAGVVVLMAVVNLCSFLLDISFPRFTLSGNGSNRPSPDHENFVLDVPTSATDTTTTVAIIYGYMRSGSTFLADVIDHHGHTFYLHEPTNYYYALEKYATLPATLPLTVGTVLTALRDCDFSALGSEWMSYMLDDKLFMLSRTSALRAYPNLQLLNASQIESACRSRSLLLAKFVRGSLTDYVPRPETVEPGDHTRIIHLVRDPRAIVNSRIRLHWDGLQEGTDSVPSMARTLCNAMLSDHETAKQLIHSGLRRQRGKGTVGYLLVKYEDLVLAFDSQASLIFGFLGRKLERRVKDFVSNVWAGHTGHGIPRLGGVKEEEEAFNTIRRNPVRLIDGWRKELSTAQVAAINSECWKVLRVYGYPI